MKQFTFSHDSETNIVSKSLIDTVSIAKAFAPILAKGDVVLLMGEVGTGKTTFTQSLVKALGVDARVHSPSFKLVNEYRQNNGLDIYHFDLYRLSCIEEVENLGWDEYLFSDGIKIIEWAEHAQGLWPSKRWEVLFSHIDIHTRKLEFRHCKKK